MSVGVVGRKVGMTRVFSEDGVSTPVTVIEVSPNRVTQVKTKDVDGYQAIQVTKGEKKASRINKAEEGHFKKAGVAAGSGLWEFRTEESFELGSEIKVDRFEVGQKVDVCGVSKGKGYAGTIKRHNFRGQDNTHGNSISHRVPGSIGQNQTPGRVFKGKKMSGQMGNKRSTVQNIDVVRVDAEQNLILVKGAIPGPAGADVIVRNAVKSKG